MPWGQTLESRCTPAGSRPWGVTSRVHTRPGGAPSGDPQLGTWPEKVAFPADILLIQKRKLARFPVSSGSRQAPTLHPTGRPHTCALLFYEIIRYLEFQASTSSP